MPHPLYPIFVYGTLKRGGSNHALLADQRFAGLARTEPHYRLYSLGSYPGLVEAPEGGLAIEGELWEVEARRLPALDRLEGVHEGLYCRVPARLQPPHHDRAVEVYLYLLSVAGLADCGASWPV